MRYLGGKSRIANRIAEVIGGGHLLIEPFMGGGAMTKALAPRFVDVRAYDIHPDLVLMWQAVLAGWDPPSVVTEEDYQRLRGESPSALRGFAGFGASFGGKWFGGYARAIKSVRGYADESKRSIQKARPDLWNVDVDLASYDEISVPADATVYADPPYAGTTGYANAFDNTAFWRKASEWADAGARVFVSEYAAPAGWERVWSAPFTRGLAAPDGSKPSVTESLFYKPAYGGY